MRADHSEIPNTPPPDQSQLTLKKLNELHRQFWFQQSALRDRRISDPVIYASATKSMNWEALRGTPLKLCKTLEQALADAESDKILFQTEHSRKGGRAPKGDALNHLIQERVLLSPNITQQQLFWQLKREVGQGIIDSIEGESDALAGEARKIRFHNEDGRPKRASVTGLKDRLARTKAKINSR